MATNVSIIDKSGAEVEVLELNEAWLEREKGDQAVKDSVVAFLAGVRSGSANTKNRSQITGTGGKPYRQKGTGRARQGSCKSPVLRGGGTVFGPTPRSYAKQVNKKVQKLALRRAFTERIDAGEVIVVDDFVVDEPKTRAVASLLKSIGAGDEALVLIAEPSANVEVASSNLPNTVVMPVASVNTYFMLLFKKIVVTRAALEILGARIGAEKKETAE